VHQAEFRRPHRQKKKKKKEKKKKDEAAAIWYNRTCRQKYLRIDAR
jgi:hypothetical protein